MSLLKHEVESLKKAIILQQKKNKRGKRLNLIGEESQGFAEIFSPERVCKARDYLIEQKELERVQVAEKEAKKAD
jgi:hypothetical protein